MLVLLDGGFGSTVDTKKRRPDHGGTPTPKCLVLLDDSDYVYKLDTIRWLASSELV